MSGASGLNFNIMSDLVANNTATIAQTLGCTDDFDSAATTQCLRDIPLQKLTDESVSFARRLRPPFGELSFYPSYDGDYIQDRPSQLLKHGHFAKGIPLIASWVTNDGAWYPPPTVNDSVSAAASFATFVPGLTLASQQRILDAYPPSDFDHLVPAGGFPTAQYYRAAQINRDLWFTCPVVDFTWHYARKGNAVSDVRLYEFNTTRFGPVYEAIGVPFWRAAHLSDIPYVLNNDAVAGGADNSAPQRALSRRMSGSIAAFAHTGEPTASEGGDVLGDWPPAYEGSGQEELGREYPGQMNVRVIGGPYGDGNAAMQRGGVGEVSGRQRAVEWERLFERCELLSSLSEEIGV